MAAVKLKPTSLLSDTSGDAAANFVQDLVATSELRTTLHPETLRGETVLTTTN